MSTNFEFIDIKRIDEIIDEALQNTGEMDEEKTNEFVEIEKKLIN